MYIWNTQMYYLHVHTHTHTHAQDCCSELEAMGAGAAHASSKVEKQEQINRDVPRICYKILDKEYGCAMGEFMEQNVQEKMVSLLSEIQDNAGFDERI